MSERVSVAVILCAVAVPFALTSVAIGQPKPPSMRIGTFDSRAVALAYWRSEEGVKHTKAIHEKYEKAKAAQDEKRMRQLESEGPGLQVRMHQQVFSTGSVTDIIEKMKASLPPIAKEAGVSIIVSKWQVAYRHPSVEYVDVTPHLVKQFNPSDEVVRMIEDLRKKEPVPIEKLSMDLKQRQRKKTTVSVPNESRDEIITGEMLQAVGMQATFGPVVEMVIPAETGHLGTFVDLQTGKTFQVPEDVKDSDSREKFIAWTKETKADIVVRVRPGPICYFGSLNSYFYRSPETSWQQTTAARLLFNSDLRGGELGYGNITKRPDDLPAVYMFKTREGNGGLLEIVEFIEQGADAFGVKIRFKFVRIRDAPAAADASTNLPETEWELMHGFNERRP